MSERAVKIREMPKDITTRDWYEPSLLGMIYDRAGLLLGASYVIRTSCPRFCGDRSKAYGNCTRGFWSLSK